MVVVLWTIAGASFAGEKAYMLSAEKWTGSQNNAVRNAGGEVIWSHSKTGLGVVTSDNANFLDDVMKSRAFKEGSEDVIVEWQEPSLGEELVTPGDETLFGYQWNMWAVEAEDAWNAGCDGTGARVAIVDGGIYDIHPDIGPNLDGVCSTSFYPGEPWNSDVGTLWHGTHVAGIVAAADNGFGVIGVAPGATLMAVKVAHGGSGPFSSIIAGILFASDPGSFDGFQGCQKADIINMSLGATFRKNEYRGFIGYLTKAVNFAASKGVLVITSAGNDGIDFGQAGNLTHVPSDCGTALSISATGPVGFAFGGEDFRRPASYSNYGEGTIFVAAPGGDHTLYPDSYWFYDMVLSTSRGTSTPPASAFPLPTGPAWPLRWRRAWRL